MPFNEADTRAKLIDPALRKCGWREDWIRREQTPGPFVRTGTGYERGQGRTDYVLYLPVQEEMQPIAVVEAKAEDAAPDTGIEQAKRDARLHHVPFAFATNGHLFHETDLRTNATRGPLPVGDFPSWEELRDRWYRPGGKNAPLDAASDAAQPLWAPPREGARYYQRAARRAALESIARGENRILLPLATGAGKTWIAVSILRAVDMAGQLRRALFLCDRDELRNQALGALAAHFASDVAKATTRDPAANARVVVATYQTLGIDREDGDASFLTKHYPEDYFSHIIIDECHRSAWGKWSEVLRRNPKAIQIGLTATPRDIDTGQADDVDATEDRRITADNYEYFGEPAYGYSIAQAMQDGYLAAMEVVRSDVWTAGTLDRMDGVEREHLRDARVVDARTDEVRKVDDLREQYAPSSLEQDLQLPDRVNAMAADLFKRLLEAGGPLQKTLIFCASIAHATAVVQALNNRYAEWCRRNRKATVEPYAFACTSESGRQLIADLRGSRQRAFIAATVDLITTGVDVPCLQNIIYFRYIQSPILFHQMLGRGTRIDEATGKRHFTVLDYTNATRLLDAQLIKQRQAKGLRERPARPSEPTDSYRVEGVEVRVEDGEQRIGFVNSAGKLEFLTLEEYGRRIRSTLHDDVDELDEFRDRWLLPDQRGTLLKRLVEHGINVGVYRSVADRLDTDYYDVLTALGWGETIRSRLERAERVDGWIDGQGESAPILTALADQFGVAGTEALESPYLGLLPSVRAAGGLDTLGRVTVRDLKRQLLATDEEWAS